MQHNTIVIGGGQAGLSMGYYLKLREDDFVILDAADAVGDSWRNRYDSLVLFTPSQYDGLPGLPFPRPPDTYPTKDDVADYLERYALHMDLPVRLRTKVTHVTRAASGFVVETTQGPLRAMQVVIATGALQRPVIPKFAALLAPDVYQVHSADYRNPRQLAPGDVLVVGAGNSGAQIALELARERRVRLSIGREPRCAPQRFLGRDIFWWLLHAGLMDAKRNSWPWGRNIEASNPLIGTELQRCLRSGRIIREARVVGALGHKIRFADGASHRAANVIWATGYAHDFSWIHAPVLDRRNRLVHRRGVTEVEGLYFLGLRWLHTAGSGHLGFVERDARYLAARMTARAAHAPGLTLAASGG